VEEEGTTANIADFVLSCRVMGRGVESCMLGLAVDHARRRGLSRVTARFRATARNKPCRDFFEASGFAGGEDADQFVWHTERQFAAPAHVRLVDLSSGPSAAPA
jgi:predicted enzyme involved in methoxymalonyl-ACP biosynthesis